MNKKTRFSLLVVITAVALLPAYEAKSSGFFSRLATRIRSSFGRGSVQNGASGRLTQNPAQQKGNRPKKVEISGPTDFKHVSNQNGVVGESGGSSSNSTLVDKVKQAGITADPNKASLGPKPPIAPKPTNIPPPLRQHSSNQVVKTDQNKSQGEGSPTVTKKPVPAPRTKNLEDANQSRRTSLPEPLTKESEVTPKPRRFSLPLNEGSKVVPQPISSTKPEPLTKQNMKVVFVKKEDVVETKNGGKLKRVITTPTGKVTEVYKDGVLVSKDVDYISLETKVKGIVKNGALVGEESVHKRGKITNSTGVVNRHLRSDFKIEE